MTLSREDRRQIVDDVVRELRLVLEEGGVLAAGSVRTADTVRATRSQARLLQEQEAVDKLHRLMRGEPSGPYAEV